MRLLMLSLTISVLLTNPGRALSQDAISSGRVGDANSTGASIIVQALNASGVSDSEKPVVDFVATGTITYFWGGGAIKGEATLHGRMGGQFRVDANLPTGTRTVCANRGTAWIKEPGRERRALPLHNTLNMDVLTFPYLDLAQSLNDPSTSIEDVGDSVVSESTARRVLIRKNFSKEQDPDGTLARLSRREYFFDPATGLLIRTVDSVHPAETLTEEYEHEVEFENHVVLQGVTIPTLIRERVIGQTTWELQITKATFNNGLTDADFTSN